MIFEKQEQHVITNKTLHLLKHVKINLRAKVDHFELILLLFVRFHFLQVDQHLHFLYLHLRNKFEQELVLFQEPVFYFHFILFVFAIFIIKFEIYFILFYFIFILFFYIFTN